MKKLLASLLSVTLSVSSAQAVPQVLNFQGRLSESGSPSNGSRQIVFRIHASPTGGTALFTETRSIAVSSGIFNALIGEETPGGIPLSVFDGNDRYVEVQVGSTVLPRQKMASVAHAFIADRARSLVDGATFQIHTIEASSVTATTLRVMDVLKIGTGTITMGGTPVNGGAENSITFSGLGSGPTAGIGGLIRTAGGGGGPGPLYLQTGGSNSIFLAPGGAGLVSIASSLELTGGLAKTISATAAPLTLASGGINPLLFNPGVGSGNVGIGLAAPILPVDKLHLIGQFRLDNDPAAGNSGCLRYNGTQLEFSNDCVAFQTFGGGGLAGSGTPDHLAKFVTATTLGDSVLAEASGNIGIGTPIPSTTLDVAGNAQFGLGAMKSTFTTTGALNLANNADILLIGPAGNVVGQASVTASGFFGASMDALSARFGTGANQSLFSPAGALTFPAGYLPTVPQDAASKAYVDSLVGGAGIWTKTGSVVALTSPTDNVVMQSTLTVQGNEFSVGGSLLKVFGGEVGIGTTNPIDLFDVNGNMSLSATVPSPGTSFSADRRITYYDNNGVTPSAEILFEQDSAPGHGNEPGEISFHTRPHDVDGGGPIAERMRISRGGNVGIGILNPANKLHVIGNLQVENTAQNGALIVKPTDQGSYRLQTLQAAGTNGEIAFETGGGSTERLRINAAGNVGFGTTGPNMQSFPAGNTVVTIRGTTGGAQSGRLELASSGSILSNDVGLSNISFLNANTSIAAIHGVTNGTSGNSGDLNINTASAGVLSTAMVIKSGGKVGVGTTNPIDTLDANGNMSLSATALASNTSFTADRSITYYDNNGVTPSARILFEQDTTPGHGNEPGEISFHTKPHDVDGGGAIAERMRINRGGNVGIGTTSPTQKLDVVGTVRATAFQGDGSQLTGIVSAGETNTFTSSKTFTRDVGLATQSGNVGIGILNPANKLHVIGNLQVENTAQNGALIVKPTDQGSYRLQTLQAAGTNGEIAFETGGGSTERLRINAAGNVGFGTPGPNLQSFPAGNTVVTIRGTTGGAQSGRLELASSGSILSNDVGLSNISFLNANTSIAAIHGVTNGTSGNSGDLNINTASAGVLSTAMVIKSGGNVGIGTAIPDSKLHVVSAAPGALKIVDTTQGAGKVLTSDANGVATWQSIPPAAPAAVPAGTVLSFASDIPPAGFLECDGAPVSRAAFAGLFAVIGTRHGSGDGATTFNLPDLRGAFARGWDHGSGRDPNASTRAAALPGGATGDNVGSLQADTVGVHSHSISSIRTGSGGTHIEVVVQGTNDVGAGVTTDNVGTGIGNETRPKNISLMYVIKY